MKLFFRLKHRGQSLGLLLTFLLTWLVSGCQGVNPTLDTLRTFLPGKDPALMVAGGFEYLLLEIDGRKTAMALGSRSLVTTPQGVAVHEHWFSGHREMIHLVNGRLNTALGLTVEWRGQRSTPPDWGVLAQEKLAINWTRHLDLMPGYRFGHMDQIQTMRSRPLAGAPVVTSGAQWFSDVIRSPQAVGKDWVFEQHFAVREGRVIYSEQCLSPEVCFKFTHLGLVP